MTESLSDDSMNDRFVSIRHEAKSRWLAGCVSRFIDIVLSLLAITFLFPLMIMIAIMIKITSAGPCIYGQYRRGLNGSSFKIYKFRTMCHDADIVMERLLACDVRLRAEYEKYHKLRLDPRVTKFGRFLRLTSLDELPQLFNVIAGSMSMVGPRPYLPCEIDPLGEKAKLILSIKPGITGLWQVRYRNKSTFDQRVSVDCEHVINRSVMGDIRILLITIPSLVFFRHAY